MRSSTTPPVSSQHSVYCALPVEIRPRSLVRQALTKAAAPGPVTDALPRWLTSKMPDPLADGGVLADDPTAGVLDRHLPAPEVGHLGAQADVALVQG